MPSAKEPGRPARDRRASDRPAPKPAQAGSTEGARRARIEAWRRKNAPAIEDYNRRLEAGEFDEFLRRF
jgi:hypothetical protein